MRLATALLGLAISTPAFAGGIGLVGGGGIRSQPVYWYEDGDPNSQVKQVQRLGQMGGGLEVALGDRDERFLGFFRGYLWREGPEKNPAELTTLYTSLEEAEEHVVASYRGAPRNVGMFTVGMQAGIIGDPKNVMGTIVADVGSGFLTSDHSEFLQAEAGIGVTWAAARPLHIYANTMYSVRWRKGFMNGINGYAGFRYMFD